MVTTICCNLRTPLPISSSAASISSKNFHSDCFNLPNRPRNLTFRQNNGFSRWGTSRVLSGRNFSVVCGVQVVNQSEFPEEVLRSDLPVLVEFVAEWCGPCRLMSAAIDWASQEYKERLKVVKIDHDSNAELIREYKVFGLPALILFKNGKEVSESRREGAMTKAKLKEYLDALLESIAVA